MRLRELRQKGAMLVAKMRELNDSVGTRAMNGEETAKFETLEREYAENKAMIEREEKLRGLENYMNEPVGEPISPDVGGAQRGGFDNDMSKREFVRYISGQSFDQRVMNTGAGEDGGYLVPTILLNTIIEGLVRTSTIRPLASVMSTTSTTEIPVYNSVPEFSIIAEGGAYSEQDLKLAKKTFKAYKLGALIPLTMELQADAGVNVENFIINQLIKGLSKKEDEFFIKGNGTTQPNGLVNSIVGVTTASSIAVTLDEALELYYSVDTEYRANARFLVSDSFEKAIRRLKDSNGNYIWQPSIANDVPATLFGKPILTSGHLDGIEAGSTTAIFGDLSYYQIADRGGISIKRSDEAGFKTDTTLLKVNKRVDATLTISDAVRTLKCKSA